VYTPKKVAVCFWNLRREKRKDVTHRIGKQTARSFGTGIILRIAVM
jgi:hypothetical protein